MDWIGSAVLLVFPKQPLGFSFFSIVLGAEYSFYIKSITTYALTFLGNNNSVLNNCSEMPWPSIGPNGS
jgi:hypothetical protein